jgi:hypothetical protein
MLYILPGTRVYHELVNRGKFDERIWIKSDVVYYYTQEHSIFTLNKWRKKINRSGIRLPYNGKYFWDSIPNTNEEKINVFKKRYRKIIKKIKRFINMMRGAY